ncbi:MAG: hypothetical protein AB1345_03695 [Chloroflexota bacterium]
MSLISESDQIQLQRLFAEKLQRPVKLLMFTQERECQYCHETRMLIEELASLSEKLAAEVTMFEPGKGVSKRYGIDKIPAVVITADGDRPVDYGIRFFGIPSGYEFTSLIEDIFMVSLGDSGLSPATKDQLAKIDKPVHFQVFITPT